MSRRVENTRKNLTAAEEALRRKRESKVFELGVPLCPEYLWNNKKLWAAYQDFFNFWKDADPTSPS